MWLPHFFSTYVLRTVNHINGWSSLRLRHPHGIQGFVQSGFG